MKKKARADHEASARQTLKSLGEAAWSIQAVASDVQGAAKVVQMCLDADDACAAVRSSDILCHWTRRLNRMARENARATRSIAHANARALIADMRKAPDC